MIKYFDVSMMKYPPKVGESFRVGPFIGVCVEQVTDVDGVTYVTMESRQPVKCEMCMHFGQETTDDVAFCNCCEKGEYFMPEDACGYLNSYERE